MVSNRWIFSIGNVHLNRQSEPFNNITGNYMFHLNCHQPAIIFTFLWQAISVMSVLVGSTKTQAALGLTVHHVPATTTLIWQTQSPVTGSPGNAPSVYTTPMVQTASSANQVTLAQPSIKTVKAACAIWQVFTLPCAQGGTQPACVTQPQELVLACPMCWVPHVTSVPLATGTWLAEKDVRPVTVIQKIPKATSATRQENYSAFQEPGCWCFDMTKWRPSY